MLASSRIDTAIPASPGVSCEETSSEGRGHGALQPHHGLRIAGVRPAPKDEAHTSDDTDEDDIDMDILSLGVKSRHAALAMRRMCEHAADENKPTFNLSAF